MGDTFFVILGGLIMNWISKLFTGDAFSSIEKIACEWIDTDKEKR